VLHVSAVAQSLSFDTLRVSEYHLVKQNHAQLSGPRLSWNFLLRLAPNFPVQDQICLFPAPCGAFSHRKNRWRNKPAASTLRALPNNIADSLSQDTQDRNLSRFLHTRVRSESTLNRPAKYICDKTATDTHNQWNLHDTSELSLAILHNWVFTHQ
jgi:hypothetical protein